MAHGDWYWHELNCRDPERLAPFYEKLFGWQSKDMPMGDGPPYRLITKEGAENGHGGYLKMEGPQFEGVPPMWLVYIEVDEVDATLSEVEGQGGKIVAPAWDIPDVGRMAVITDPEGAALAVMTPSEDG
ncbi:MAG: VOC family protein [Sphingomonadaceae bacterium]